MLSTLRILYSVVDSIRSVRLFNLNIKSLLHLQPSVSIEFVFIVVIFSCLSFVSSLVNPTKYICIIFFYLRVNV